MHAAELMARLNPSTVRYDVGRGGIPQLTSQDIAAAIGMVPAGIGRDLMCLLWWPDGAALKADQLDRALTDVLLMEWTERELGMYRGLSALSSAEGRAEHSAAQRKYAEAHARRWPRWVVKSEPVTVSPVYERLRKAVLTEASDPKQCGACSGSGFMRSGGIPVACDRCEGRGTSRRGPTWRAEQLKMKEASYKETWSEPYEWLLAFVVEEATTAARRLHAAIGKDASPV